MNKGTRYSQYSEAEDAIIRANWTMLGHKMAWMLPGRTLKSIQQRAFTLGEVKKAPHWTDAEIELLCKLWPEQGRACARSFPARTVHSVRTKADQLKLRRVYQTKPARPEPVAKPELARDGMPVQVSSIWHLAQLVAV